MDAHVPLLYFHLLIISSSIPSVFITCHSPIKQRKYVPSTLLPLSPFWVILTLSISFVLIISGAHVVSNLAHGSLFNWCLCLLDLTSLFFKQVLAFWHKCLQCHLLYFLCCRPAINCFCKMGVNIWINWECLRILDL